MGILKCHNCTRIGAYDIYPTGIMDVAYAGNLWTCVGGQGGWVCEAHYPGKNCDQGFHGYQWLNVLLLKFDNSKFNLIICQFNYKNTIWLHTSQMKSDQKALSSTEKARKDQVSVTHKPNQLIWNHAKMLHSKRLEKELALPKNAMPKDLIGKEV